MINQFSGSNGTESTKINLFDNSFDGFVIIDVDSVTDSTLSLCLSLSNLKSHVEASSSSMLLGLFTRAFYQIDNDVESFDSILNVEALRHQTGCGGR